MKVVDHLFQYPEGQGPIDTYAILDAARDDVIYPKLSNFRDRKRLSLSRVKSRGAGRSGALPCPSRKDDPFTEWILNSGWGKSWGIFVQSEASLSELQRHFRKFLMVYDEDGNPLYFRFYDPRVLRVYLPTCNAGEIKTVFGPVGSYVLEDEDPSVFLRFLSDNGKCPDRKSAAWEAVTGT